MVLVRAALPAMLARGGGSIVLVSSINGLATFPDLVAYNTSKAGLIALARSIACDFGARGIRANTLCPGWVVTPMGDEAMDALAAARGISRQEAYDLATAHVPLKRAATAHEIASCCLFLASDEASIVTGTTLVADGGGLAVERFDADVCGAAVGGWIGIRHGRVRDAGVARHCSGDHASSADSIAGAWVRRPGANAPARGRVRVAIEGLCAGIDGGQA